MAEHLQHAHPRPHPAGLQHHAHPAGEGGVVRPRVEADHRRSTGVGAPKALQHLHGRGLARTVRTEHRGDLARLGLEGHGIDGDDLAVAHRQPVDLHGSHRRMTLTGRLGVD